MACKTSQGDTQTHTHPGLMYQQWVKHRDKNVSCKLWKHFLKLVSLLAYWNGTVTVVAVSDAVLQHSVPLLLLLLCHHTEVVVACVRVPKDEGKLCGTLDEWIIAHFGLDAYKKSHDATVSDFKSEKTNAKYIRMVTSCGAGNLCSSR